MSKEVEAKVKEEIEKLVKAGFIRPIRYAEWLSNVVPVIKKNGKLRIFIDFRNLNLATLKDVYVMPIDDMLVDSVANNELLSSWMATPGSDESVQEDMEIPVYGIEEQPWILRFDGSSTEGTADTGVIIISPTRTKTDLSFNLDFPCTKNQAEYEALVIGLEVLKDLKAKNVQLIGDSQLVLRQVAGEYKCASLSLTPYFSATSQLADDFEEINFQYVPRKQNWETNELVQIASGLRLSEELIHRLVLIQKKNHTSIIQRGLQVENVNMDVNLARDWREELKKALQFPEKSVPYGLRMKVLNYILVEGDLYIKGKDGLLLQCIGFPEAL
ncbi:uncharacterized protein [Henckelia pumila]|uniref:uncharacterized protein n=1 Tax=Henckelia pumila TaxID=405737 RepID=UPI003C6EA210